MSKRKFIHQEHRNFTPDRRQEPERPLYRAHESLPIRAIIDYDGQLCVAKELCKDEAFVKRILIPSIIGWIRAGEVRFPYKQDWMPLKEIEDNMKRFPELKLVTDNKPYRIC